MGSIVAEKRPLENGDCSLFMAPPRYKRRKISAIRDFPDGCGPHAARTSLQLKEVGSSGQKEDVFLRNLDCSGEKGKDMSAAVKIIAPEEKLESQSHDSFVCPNAVDVEESILMICAEVQREDGDTSSCLMERRVDSSSAQIDIGALDLKETAHTVGNKIVDEGNSAKPFLLPHYPIPPKFVWKEPKYPPRRRVSAVRDFPVGCGRNVPRLADTKVVTEGDPDSNKAVVLKDVNPIGKVREDDYVDKDQVQGLESGKVMDIDAHYSGIEKPPLSSNSYEMKEQEESSKDKNGEDLEKGVEQIVYNRKGKINTGSMPDGLNKELVVYVKDDNKKKNSTSLRRNNVGLQEVISSGVGSDMGIVVVQGLMSEPHGSHRKVAVKTTPTTTSIKRKKGKKCDISGQNTRKISLNQSKEDTNNLAEKGVIIPYFEEDIDEISRPLDIRDSVDDSSEDDEANAFQFLPRGRVCDVNLPPFGASSSSERGIRSKVRETLRLFQVVYRKLLQEEETKSKDQENASKRVDLRAAKILKESGKYLNTTKVIGPVPGVEVGDIFNYRIELAIIGLHGPLQGGIDTTKLDKQPVAISIVASGGYANDVDSSDVLIYTGQGGNATGGDKQPEDQKLERGNLALKNCIDKKTLVRVIRGFKETKPSDISEGRGKTIATYTYDGLYTVDKYWHDLGPHGKLVYKFELNRVPGQPELAWKEVKQSKKFKTREGFCVADISEGKEKLPICAVNTIDDEKPPPFMYMTSVMYPDWCRPIPPKGCDCKNGCSDSDRCACAVKNGGDIPFNYSGAIVQAKPLVYECGPLCKCPPSCHNRVSQHGIKLPLEVFKTDSRGWGVRCLSAISSGSFICEYIGDLLDDKEAEQRTGNDEYLFDIGQNYNDSSLWDELSSLLPDMPSNADDVVENVGFTIDAARNGNIGRFINHSCTPNLYAQNVLYDHEDKRIPHIMLFAAENIPPLQELTYHYNYTIDQVFDSEGNIKKKSCYCGSVECTGRMY